MKSIPEGKLSFQEDGTFLVAEHIEVGPGKSVEVEKLVKFIFVSEDEMTQEELEEVVGAGLAEWKQE